MRTSKSRNKLVAQISCNKVFVYIKGNTKTNSYYDKMFVGLEMFILENLIINSDYIILIGINYF